MDQATHQGQRTPFGGQDGPTFPCSNIEYRELQDLDAIGSEPQTLQGNIAFEMEGLWGFRSCSHLAMDAYRFSLSQTTPIEIVPFGRSLRTLLFKVDDGSWQLIAQHDGSLEADPATATQGQRSKVMLSRELTDGTYVLAVGVSSVSELFGRGIASGENLRPYTVELAAARPCPSLGSLPAVITISEREAWYEGGLGYFFDDRNWRFPKFDIEVDGRSLGTIQTLDGQLQLGSVKVGDRDIVWTDGSGAQLLATKEVEDWDGARTITVYNCRGATIGTLQTKQDSGTLTWYEVRNGTGEHVADSFMDQRWEVGAGQGRYKATYFTLVDPTGERVLAEISRSQSTGADAWRVDMSMVEAQQRLDPRLFVTIAASKTHSDNNGQRDCYARTDMTKLFGADEQKCTECCAEEGSGQSHVQWALGPGDDGSEATYRCFCQ